MHILQYTINKVSKVNLLFLVRSEDGFGERGKLSQTLTRVMEILLPRLQLRQQLKEEE